MHLRLYAVHFFKYIIHYADISASYELLSIVRDLNFEISQIEPTIVLSAGLAPGLINMFVKNCYRHSDKINTANIYLMLGLEKKYLNG